MDSNFIDRLSKSIKKNHDKFLKNIGEIPYKVSADYALLLVDTTTKINLISTILIDQDVIDNFESINHGSYNEITLSKIGLDFKIKMLTNGTSIHISTDSGMFGSSELVKIISPCKSGYDWSFFSEQLLEYIHINMYKSQISEDINFDSFMRGDIV